MTLVIHWQQALCNTNIKPLSKVLRPINRWLSLKWRSIEESLHNWEMREHQWFVSLEESLQFDRGCERNKEEIHVDTKCDTVANIASVMCWTQHICTWESPDSVVVVIDDLSLLTIYIIESTAINYNYSYKFLNWL